MIGELCAQLRWQDDQFVRGLKQHAEDTDDCLSAMAQELETLHEAYTIELTEIERAFMKVREVRQGICSFALKRKVGWEGGVARLHRRRLQS